MVLTLYSEVDCGGKSAVIKDREVNLTKVGVNFKVKVKTFLLHLMDANQ